MPPKVPSVIHCNSESDLQHELVGIRTSLSLTETEETWDKISNGLLRLTALCKGGASDYPTDLTSALRSLSRPITSAASSERTRLSAAALELITALATGLGPSFEPLIPILLPTLLSLCSRPNKVVTSRAKAVIQALIDQTQLPSILTYLVQGLGDKSVTLRIIAIESILACLNCLNPPDLEKEVRAKDIEGAIRATATDASGDVRKISRQVFDAYKILLPGRVDSFTSPLSPTAKKYLNIKSLTTSTSTTSTTSRPQSSQSTYSTHSTAVARPVSVAAKLIQRPATSMAHTRAASSSSLAASTKSSAPTKAAPLGRSQTQPGLEGATRGRAMLPPVTVPVRAQTRPQSQGAQRVERPAETSAPSSRAPSASRMGALRPEVAQRPVGATTGPVRPPKEDAKPMTMKERVMGGARRVPMPPPAHSVEKEKEDAAAPPSRPAVTTRKAAEAPKISQRQPVPPPRTAEQASSSSTKATGAEAKPAAAVVRTRERKPSTFGRKEPPNAAHPAPAQPVKHTAKPETAPEAPQVKKVEKKKEQKERRTGGVTQPTLSQLARMKAAEEEKQAAVAKLRPVRPLTIRPKTKTATTTTQQKSQSQHAATPPKEDHAAEVPLPDSPVDALYPALIPLPVSPAQKPVSVQKEIAEVVLNEAPTVEEPASPEVSDEEDEVSPETGTAPEPETETPAKDSFLSAQHLSMATKTPISALVSSIERGFVFTPNLPLSPPSSYETGEVPPAPWAFGGWATRVEVHDETSFDAAIVSKEKHAPEEGGEARRALIDMN